eukprot:3139730-Prymnesium_polylepis.1
MQVHGSADRSCENGLALPSRRCVCTVSRHIHILFWSLRHLRLHANPLPAAENHTSFGLILPRTAGRA